MPKPKNDKNNSKQKPAVKPSAGKKQVRTKKAVGRPCSVCSHDAVKQINSLINNGKSFRAISCQIQGNDKMRMSIQRHTENCLKLELATLIKENKIENAIDHYQEISEQLQFAKDLRIAAREYLSDPETGRLILIPRSDEISVIYEDYMDLTPKGNPKKKTDLLDTLLERAKEGRIEPLRTIVKHVDIRQFALNAINTVDTVLDKIAKKENLYGDKSQTNNINIILTDEDKAKELFRRLVELRGWNEKEAIEGIKERFPTIDVNVLTEGK